MGASSCCGSGFKPQALVGAASSRELSVPYPWDPPQSARPWGAPTKKIINLPPPASRLPPPASRLPPHDFRPMTSAP